MFKMQVRLTLPRSNTKLTLQTRFVVSVAALYFLVLHLVCIDYVAKKARLDAVLEPLGCAYSATKWSECQHKILSYRFSERTKVIAQDIALHREQAIQRSLVGPTEYENIRVFPISHHPALNHMDPDYAPRPNWDVDIAIPDIAIVGLAKAGTTQLFRVLVSHPNATSFVEGVKEFCLPYDLYKLFEDVWDDYTDDELVDEGKVHDDDNDDDDDDVDDNNKMKPTELQLDAQKALFWHHMDNFFNDVDSSHQRRQNPSNEQLLTVNACYHNWDTELTRHYLLPYAKEKKIGHQKYIVLFRDPADLLWSAFNYWKIPGLDYGGEGWTDEDENYRSPELFHELLLAGNQTSWFWEDVHDHFRHESVRNPRKLLGMFGPDNVLFLRNEDMLPSVVAEPEGVLDRVSAFTGLKRDLFPKDAYSNVANCNDKAMQNCGATRSSSYRIAGNREMLPESRTLIYLHFLEECKIWQRDFGIVYPDCLNVLETTSTFGYVPDL